MSAAAASRDVTLFHAMTNLHNNLYGLSKALSQLVPSGGPVLCRDEMEEWSSGEANLFEEALQKYGKDFTDIHKDFLPWKTLSCIVEYYYMWKTTDRYLQQKRLKAVSKECNLTQIYIPGLAPSNPAQPGKKQTSTIILTPPPGVTSNLVGATCEGCFGTTSQQWYPWSPNNSPHKLWLCTLCWIYWKKYGGLKRPDGFSGRGQDNIEPRYTCRLCGKVFNRAERLSSHMMTHKSYKCVVRGCDKFFNSKATLQRHLTGGHGYRPPSPRKLKPRSPFYMSSNVSIVNLGLKRITDPKETAILKAERKMKKRVLEKAVEYIREHPQKPSKLSKPSLLPLHGINAGQEKGSPPTSPGLSVTSPARKMMPPVKNYLSAQSATPSTNTWKYSAIPPAKTVTPSSNHMLARKRSYEGSGIQQNGIDGPTPKRMSATSPLGKKGCECSYCGKILHNQESAHRTCVYYPLWKCLRICPQHMRVLSPLEISESHSTCVYYPLWKCLRIYPQNMRVLSPPLDMRVIPLRICPQQHACIIPLEMPQNLPTAHACIIPFRGNASESAHSTCVYYPLWKCLRICPQNMRVLSPLEMPQNLPTEHACIIPFGNECLRICPQHMRVLSPLEMPQNLPTAHACIIPFSGKCLRICPQHMRVLSPLEMPQNLPTAHACIIPFGNASESAHRTCVYYPLGK
ncbi:hypothetical protein QZH41_014855 [Actinostola sp. cb2023]|nr:hypothetical protein QZH41_014855 [Actinostola sp. cb2023]